MTLNLIKVKKLDQCINFGINQIIINLLEIILNIITHFYSFFLDINTLQSQTKK